MYLFHVSTKKIPQPRFQRSYHLLPQNLSMTRLAFSSSQSSAPSSSSAENCSRFPELVAKSGRTTFVHLNTAQPPDLYYNLVSNLALAPSIKLLRIILTHSYCRPQIPKQSKPQHRAIFKRTKITKTFSKSEITYNSYSENKSAMACNSRVYESAEVTVYCTPVSNILRCKKHNEKK